MCVYVMTIDEIVEISGGSPDAGITGFWGEHEYLQSWQNQQAGVDNQAPSAYGHFVRPPRDWL